MYHDGPGPLRHPAPMTDKQNRHSGGSRNPENPICIETIAARLGLAEDPARDARCAQIASASIAVAQQKIKNTSPAPGEPQGKGGKKAAVPAGEVTPAARGRHHVRLIACPGEGRE
ncbi:MAG: hypothetical protein COB49_02095 [Alphaproteobacteria bacterium]|nr:MAG: hypothetical protein COB49_02095 [Alphaproteobacteria bacterium]